MKRVYYVAYLCLSCLLGLGVITIDKIVGVFVYWSLFPFVVGNYGATTGLTALFAGQVLVSIFALVVYDMFGGDVLKISTTSNVIVRLWHRLRNKIFGERDLVSENVAHTIAFVLLSWQCSPPFVILLRRKDHKDRKGGLHSYEMLLVTLSAFISTLWWGLYSLGLLRFWHWCQH